MGSRYDSRDRDGAFLAWNNGKWLGKAETAAQGSAYEAATEAIEAAAAKGIDKPLAEVIPDGGPYARSVRCILQLMSSGDPEQVSSKSYADYAETDHDWPVRSGYADLIEKMANGLPIRLNTAVDAVSQTSGGVEISTGSGTLMAKAAIVTVSTNVLRSGALRIGPGPAARILDMVEDVPCGSYEKVAFALDRPLFADPATRFCMMVPEGEAPAMSIQIVNGSTQHLIAHMAGTPALDAGRTGPEGLIELATGLLVSAFGSQVRAGIRTAAATERQTNSLVRGAYSFARPGKAQTRYDMMAAETGRIAFAGEAFSPQWQATVHGAYQTGRDSAARIAGDLGQT